MKRLIAALALVSLSCAGQQRAEQQSTPQCLSLCNNNFAACTEEFPGDYGACRRDLQTCQNACEEQKALERMEKGDEEIIVEPPEGGIEPPAEEAPEVPEAPEG